MTVRRYQRRLKRFISSECDYCQTNQCIAEISFFCSLHPLRKDIEHYWLSCSAVAGMAFQCFKIWRGFISNQRENSSESTNKALLILRDRPTAPAKWFVQCLKKTRFRRRLLDRRGDVKKRRHAAAVYRFGEISDVLRWWCIKNLSFSP